MIFQSICGMGNLKKLDLSLNMLRNLTVLALEDNNFNGSLPTLYNLTELLVLNLGNNEFVGNVPYEWITLSSLLHLKFEHNFLEGEIPSIFQNMTKLQALTFNNNKFSGVFPDEDIPNLVYVDGSWNNLGAWVRSRHHRDMSWHSDTFWHVAVGRFTSSEGASLISYIDFSHNHINETWGTLSTALTHLDLSWNNINSLITGPEAQYLTQLTYLDLSHNQFFGHIIAVRSSIFFNLNNDHLQTHLQRTDNVDCGLLTWTAILGHQLQPADWIFVKFVICLHKADDSRRVIQFLYWRAAGLQ